MLCVLNGKVAIAFYLLQETVKQKDKEINNQREKFLDCQVTFSISRLSKRPQIRSGEESCSRLVTAHVFQT